LRFNQSKPEHERLGLSPNKSTLSDDLAHYENVNYGRSSKKPHHHQNFHNHQINNYNDSDMTGYEYNADTDMIKSTGDTSNLSSFKTNIYTNKYPKSNENETRHAQKTKHSNFKPKDKSESKSKLFGYKLANNQNRSGYSSSSSDDSNSAETSGSSRTSSQSSSRNSSPQNTVNRKSNSLMIDDERSTHSNHSVDSSKFRHSNLTESNNNNKLNDQVGKYVTTASLMNISPVFTVNKLPESETSAAQNKSPMKGTHYNR
jgi:hypothetical protein